MQKRNDWWKKVDKEIFSFAHSEERQAMDDLEQWNFLSSVEGKWEDGDGRTHSFITFQRKNSTQVNNRKKKKRKTFERNLLVGPNEEPPNKQLKLNENAPNVNINFNMVDLTKFLLNSNEDSIQIFKPLRKEKNGDDWWSTTLISHIEREDKEFGFFISSPHLIPSEKYKHSHIYSINVKKWVESYSEELPQDATPKQFSDWRKRVFDTNGMKKTPKNIWESMKGHLSRIGLHSIDNKSDTDSIIKSIQIQSGEIKSLIQSWDNNRKYCSKIT